MAGMSIKGIDFVMAGITDDKITIHVYSIGCNDFLFDIAHEEDIGFLAKNLDIGFIATLIIIEIMLEMIHPWKKKMTCSLSIVGNCLMRYFNVMNFI